MNILGWFRRTRAANVRQGESETNPALVDMHGGRLRARGIPYQLPRDLEEMNRLDFQHYIVRQALKGNYAAPLHNPTSILDVGAGTGRWAREVAQVFPDANVVGLDITPPPADEAAAMGAGPDLRPENYSFVSGNALEGLPFADATFDFTHMRFLATAIPHDRWPFVVGELARVTRPGGWVESVEASVPEQGGPAMDELMTWFKALFSYRGVQFGDGATVADLLRTVGLANIQTQTVQIPYGSYGGRIGKMAASDVFTALKGVSGLFISRRLATAEQFEQTLAQATADVAAPQTRCVVTIYIAYGQRR